MIISKTPYRISFFGGGSDYPEWFLKNDNYGEVISVTIDKYVYLSIRELSPFFGYKYRASYSKIEETNNVNDIKHKAIKGIIKYYKPKTGLEIHYDGDLPARSGMGSSSSFAVGIINAYNALINRRLTKKKLASESVYFEHDFLKENVGVQDQIAASYGGFNIIKMNKKGNKLKKLNLDETYFKKLNKNLFLIFTGQLRIADKIAQSFIKDISTKKEKNILSILNHVNLAKKIIEKNSLDDFGYLLNETWIEKKKLSSIVSNSKIDEIYNLGLNSGSLGGKLLGAGNGGFILFYVPLKNQEEFKKKFKSFISVPFNFVDTGSQIISTNK